MTDCKAHWSNRSARQGKNTSRPEILKAAPCVGRLQKGAGTSCMENREPNPTVGLTFQVRVSKGGTSVLHLSPPTPSQHHGL